MNSPVSDPPVLVSDTGPLIALDKVGLLPLLPVLGRAVFVPPAVLTELEACTQPAARGLVERFAWVAVRAPSAPPDPTWPRRLHAGEAQALQLARETEGSLLLIDDAYGRSFAQAKLGLEVRGTLGVLVAARKRNLIAQVEPFIASLLAAGERLSGAAVDAALRSVGERG